MFCSADVKRGNGLNAQSSSSHFIFIFSSPTQCSGLNGKREIRWRDEHCVVLSFSLQFFLLCVSDASVFGGEELHIVGGA